MAEEEASLVRRAVAAKLGAAASDVSSQVRWMRRSLDAIEGYIRDERGISLGSSTTTEALFKAVGRWNGLIEMRELWEATEEE